MVKVGGVLLSCFQVPRSKPLSTLRFDCDWLLISAPAPLFMSGLQVTLTQSLSNCGSRNKDNGLTI